MLHQSHKLFLLFLYKVGEDFPAKRRNKLPMDTFSSTLIRQYSTLITYKNAKKMFIILENNNFVIYLVII
jgi:hypothetical protein